MQRTHGRAYWVVGLERGELREEVLRPPSEGEVCVATRYSGISKGTELRVFRGQVPVSERDRMRAPHQAGELPWPVKYGYCSVGEVVSGGASLLGKTVFCLYPHQDAYVVPETSVVPLPEGVPARRAVLGANLETALNAIWDADVRAGDRVTVVGGGVLGLMVAYLAARHPGAVVQVVDIDPSREQLVERLHASFALPDAAQRDAHVVIHASGTPAGLRTSLELATKDTTAKDTTVVELSFYGDEEVTLPLGAGFHSQRVRIQSSQVGSVAPVRSARVTPRARLELALRLLRDPLLDALLEPNVAFVRLPEVMQQLASGQGARLCQVVEY